MLCQEDNEVVEKLFKDVQKCHHEESEKFKSLFIQELKMASTHNQMVFSALFIVTKSLSVSFGQWGVTSP